MLPPQPSTQNTENSNEGLFNRIWNFLSNNNVKVGGVGAAAGTYAGHLAGPAAIHWSVTLGCEKLIGGAMGKLVGMLAGPAFAAYAGPVMPLAGGVAGLGITIGGYQAYKWISGYWSSSEKSANNDELVTRVGQAVSDIVKIASKDPKQAQAIISSIEISNPILANLIAQALAATLEEAENEIQQAADEFILIDDPKVEVKTMDDDFLEKEPTQKLD